MNFIRKGGRIIPIGNKQDIKPKKSTVVKKANKIIKNAAAGARFGGSLAAIGVVSHHVSNLLIKGKTAGTYKNTAKAIGFGMAAGAGLGVVSGMFRKKKVDHA